MPEAEGKKTTESRSQWREAKKIVCRVTEKPAHINVEDEDLWACRHCGIETKNIKTQMEHFRMVD